MAARRVRLDIRQASRTVLLALAALVAVNAVIYATVVRPKVQAYRELQEANRPKFEQLETRGGTVEHVEGFLGALEQAEVDLKRLREDILSTRRARMVDVELELARLAGQFGIDLDSVSFESAILPGEGLDRFAMTVPLEGGYANLRRFLQAAEDSDKFLVVERVALGQSKEGGRNLQLNITMATYFNAPVPDRPARTGGRATARPASRQGKR